MRIKFITAICINLLIISHPSSAQERIGEKPETVEPASPPDEPDLVITPNTIRIEPLASPQDGHWVVMKGFSELGSPSFSNDGEWIAFDAYLQGYNNSPSECWTVRKDGRDLKRLAVGATPRWSPDGEKLLFMRDEANDPKREPGVFLINRDGTGERRIGDGRWPDWSPGGKRIVFSEGGTPGGGLRVGARVVVADADGSNRREIADGDCPGWSPDGSKIVYCFQLPDRLPILRIFDLKANREETLGIGWYRANWMPDGKSLVANGVVGRHIGMVRLTLGEPEKEEELPSEFEKPFSPCCSADGKQIVYIAKRPKPKAP